MTETLELPILLAGRKLTETDADPHAFDYGGGLRILSPTVSLDGIRDVLATNRLLLKALHLEEIVLFFDEVAKAWMNPKNPWRRMALRYGPAVTGYAVENIERDIDFVGGSMFRAHLIDLVETDLGDAGVLDDWTRYKSIHYKAWPKGVATHIMVGNVPLAGFFTLVRSLVTKNITIAKTSSRDMLIPQCLVQCIHDVDPSHPVVKALSALYWPAESDIETAVIAGSDVLTVWGRHQSITAIKQRVPAGIDVVEFGPMRSLSVIDTTACEDLDRAAMWIAFDTINYNQEACFSNQEVFCIGPTAELRDRLADWLERFSRIAAPAFRDPDADAHVLRARLEAQAFGWDVRSPDAADWTVIETDEPCRVEDHPLGRTVFVHPCRSMDDVLGLIDDNVQGVALEPFSLARDWADAISALGACRLIPVGRSCRMREGFIHDGFHPMRRMIRWSAIERHDAGAARFRNRPSCQSDDNYRAWGLEAKTYREISSFSGYEPFETRAPKGLVTFAPFRNGLTSQRPGKGDQAEGDAAQGATSSR